MSELIEVTRTGRSSVRYTADTDSPRRFSNSELSTWKWCKRSWMLRHYRELGLLREDPVSAAGLGTLVHLGMETWYGAPKGERDAEACLEVVRERVKADILLFEEQPAKVVKINKQGKLAVTMLEGYFEWLEETGADSELEIISAEESVDLPVPGLPGVRLLGKLDVRVRRHIDGARLFVDHKTVQSIDQTASMAYMQPQFRHYGLLEYLKFLDDKANGLTETYERTDGVIVNMLRKVGRTAAAKPPFYGREEVHHNVTVMRNHWTQVVGIILEILEAREALDKGADHHEICPPSPSRDCEWRCIFRPICPMFDDGGDPEAVIRFSYTQTDPLARYGESDEED